MDDQPDAPYNIDTEPGQFDDDDVEDDDYERQINENEDEQQDEYEDGVMKLAKLSKPTMLKICSNFNKMLKIATNKKASKEPNAAKILLSTGLGSKSSESLIKQALHDVSRIPSSPPKKAVPLVRANVKEQPTVVKTSSKAIQKEPPKGRTIRRAASFSKIIDESFIQLSTPPDSPDPPQMFSKQQVKKFISSKQMYSMDQIKEMLAEGRKKSEKEMKKMDEEPRKYTMEEIKQIQNDMEKKEPRKYTMHEITELQKEVENTEPKKYTMEEMKQMNQGVENEKPKKSTMEEIIEIQPDEVKKLPKKYTMVDIQKITEDIEKEEPKKYTLQQLRKMRQNVEKKEEQLYTMEEFKKMEEDMGKKDNAKDMVTSTPSKSPSPIPKHIPTGTSPVLSQSGNCAAGSSLMAQATPETVKKRPVRNRATEEPTRVSKRIKSNSSANTSKFNASGLIKIDQVLSNSRKSLFQEKSSIMEDSLQSIPAASPLQTSLTDSVKQAVIKANINTETRKLLDETAAVITQGQKIICDNLIETQTELVESTRKMAQSVSSGFKKQCKDITGAMTEVLKEHATDLADTVSSALSETNDQVLKAAKASIDRHVETIDAISTVEEKLADVILKKQIKMVQGLDKITAAVNEASNAIAESQKVMMTGIVNMSDVLTKVADRMGEAVQTITKNLDMLAESQSRINHSHLARAVEHCEYAA